MLDKISVECYLKVHEEFYEKLEKVVDLMSVIDDKSYELRSYSLSSNGALSVYIEYADSYNCDTDTIVIPLVNFYDGSAQEMLITDAQEAKTNKTEKLRGIALKAQEETVKRETSRLKYMESH